MKDIQAKQGSPKKVASESQATWALLTSLVAAARLEAHGIHHLAYRLKKISDSASPSEKDLLYAMLGDVLLNLPSRVTVLETLLDKAGYAMTQTWDRDLRQRLSASDRDQVQEAVESAGNLFMQKKPPTTKKIADKAPPLGYPGGPCHVVERIEDEIQSPTRKEILVDQVEAGKDLSNADASKVYDLEVERGPNPVIAKIEITAHAQYRMDLRSITVPEVRLALKNFTEAYRRGEDAHRQKSTKAALASLASQFLLWRSQMEKRTEVEYTDPKQGLYLVFQMSSPGTARIVTTYWKGVPDPRPSGACKIRKSSVRRVATLYLSVNRLVVAHSSSRPPVEEWATPKTFVSPKRQEPTQYPLRLPNDPTPASRTQNIPQPAYNTPSGGSASGNDIASPGHSAVPGETYGHPWKNDGTQPTRRVDKIADPFVAENLVEDSNTNNLGYPSAFNPVNTTERVPPTPSGQILWTTDQGYTTRTDGGSAKVVPPGTGALAETSADKVATAYLKQAAKYRDLEALMNPVIMERSKTLPLRLVKKGPGDQWAFRVDSADPKKDPYLVRVKALPGPGKSLDTRDIKVSCTCPAWVYQGPEHWAHMGKYLLGKPVGNLAAPVVRDAPGRNRLCKHAVAALQASRGYWARE